MNAQTPQTAPQSALPRSASEGSKAALVAMLSANSLAVGSAVELAAADLTTMDLTAHRPQVLVISAGPGTPRSAQWEPQVRAAGYLLIASDGTNHFYIAAEISGSVAAREAAAPASSCELERIEAANQELRAELRAGQVALELAETRLANQQQRLTECFAESQALRSALAEGVSEQVAEHERANLLEQQLQVAGTEVGALQVQLRDVSEQLQTLLASRSWRITAPLRRLTGA